VTKLTEVPTIRETSFLGMKLMTRGKVRDIYEIERDRLLIVATDRLSAFDVVMNEGIPGKGHVLTQMSRFWFDFFGPGQRNHLITADVEDYPAELQPYRAQLAGRSMLVRKAKPFPIECVVRGYLSGSGWKDYRRTGAVCGIHLPAGLVESDKLPEPLFTPATKAQQGHDENINWEQTVDLVGSDVAAELRDRSVRLYERAAEYAQSRGILIADTKFEWGLDREGILLIDEVLTPDSSRFWPKSGYVPGRSQPSFDKQFVRDYLESVNWNKQPPAPPLPPQVVELTSQKYQEAFRLLTDAELN
jgi:phosphoribosylaminoimidazole-succinocarboxamide synthase